MRLTSLTLHGFKSFGDRTTVEFSKGVTAIIGPNGSGKSNLIEALRWATGGGRASEYRADSKTDLIFHGTAGKRGVNYAEVALELLNDNHTYRVSRSLFRDGTGKLKLDGKNARFLDVDDALSGTGLGRSSLAIIGQGEVGQVLMASPEKLLEYVAEAAGVAKLSSRREQAISRLETATLNLERLEDVWQALERQVAHLREEAAQATQHNELSAEALRLRYTLAFGRVESLQKEIEGLEVERVEVSDVLQEGRELLAEAQRTWQAARGLSTRLEAAYREVATLAETRRGDVRVASERVTGLGERLSALQRERATVTQERDRLAQADAPQPPDIAVETLREAAAHVAEAQSTASQTAQSAEAELTELGREVEAMRRRQVQEAQAAATYQLNLTNLQAQREALAGRLGGLEVSDNLPSDQLAELSAQVEQANERATQLGEEVATLQQQYAQASAEAAALRRAAERSRAAFEARRGYAQGPKHALTSGIAGVYGSVADLLKVDEAYRTALSSALGRRAEYIVVDTAQTAQAVLKHVKRKGGWVTALPLDLVKGRRPNLSTAFQNATGVVGLAAELVEVASEFEGVVNQLLGNTILVATLEDGVALAKRHSSRPRLISLTGDVVESYGAMSGGQNRGAASVIGAAGDLEEAEAAAEEARKLSEKVLRDLTAKQEETRAAKADTQTLTAELNTLQGKVARQREARAINESLRGEVTAQLAEVERRLKGLEPPPQTLDAAQVTDAEARLTSLNVRVQELRSVAAATSERYREAGQALVRAEERWQGFLEGEARYAREQQHLKVLTDKNTDLAALEVGVAQQLSEAETALQAAKDAVPQDVEEKKAAWQQALRDSETAEASLAPLSEAQAERAERLEKINLTLARREAALESAEEEFAEFPEGLAVLELSSRACRDRLNTVTSELEALGPVNHRAAVDLEQEETRLNELAAQIDEATKAVSELGAALTRIDRETTSRLNAAIDELRIHFKRFVVDLFGANAEADVSVLSEEGRPQGLNILLQPPGKRTRSLNLLSVGERTMGALAFLFSLMRGGDVGGLPLAVLDEVDAPLDEANIRRYCAFVDQLAKQGTQFVLITHQKATFDIADVLWGVTSERGTSRLFSVAKAEHAVVG